MKRSLYRVYHSSYLRSYVVGILVADRQHSNTVGLQHAVELLRTRDISVVGQASLVLVRNHKGDTSAHQHCRLVNEA